MTYHNEKIHGMNMELEYSWIEYHFPLHPEVELIRSNFIKTKIHDLFKLDENKVEMILEAYEKPKLLLNDPMIPSILFQDERKEKYTKLFKNMVKEIVWRNIQEDIESVTMKEMNDTVYLSYSDITYEISKKMYERIHSQIIVDLPVKEDKRNEFIDTIIWCLYCRYDALGLLSGYSGSVPGKIYESLHKEYECECECFGSFFNHELKYYFGLFYDLEKYFGCLGNFFGSKLKKGFYVCNPPFTVNIINKTIIKCEELMKKSNELSILFFLPVWDISDRIILNRYQKKNKIRAPYLVTNYKNDIISKRWYYKKDKNLRLYDLYLKYDFLYYDCVKERNMNYAATNIILYSTKDIELVPLKKILPTASIKLLENEERMGGITKKKRGTRKRRTKRKRIIKRRKKL